MRKFNIFSTVLLMTLMTASPLKAAMTSIDGCDILGEGCMAAEPPQPQLIALSWGDVVTFLFGKKGSKGRRLPSDPPNTDVCMMVPGIMADLEQPMKGTANTVMARQPLFLWQGEATQIKLYDANNPINKPIWTRPIKAEQQHIVYDGEALVPNSLGYYWQLTLKYPPRSRPNESPRKDFLVLDEDTTVAIQKQFDKIEKQSISDTEKALKRIEILSKKEYGPTQDEELAADILAEINKLDEVPPELASLKQHDFCAEPEASVS